MHHGPSATPTPCVDLDYFSLQGTAGKKNIKIQTPIVYPLPIGSMYALLMVTFTISIPSMLLNVSIYIYIPYMDPMPMGYCTRFFLGGFDQRWSKLKDLLWPIWGGLTKIEKADAFRYLVLWDQGGTSPMGQSGDLTADFLGKHTHDGSMVLVCILT